MRKFKKNKGFNMKNKGKFDFGNKGIYDIKTETKDQSVVEADKSKGNKSIYGGFNNIKVFLMNIRCKFNILKEI